MRTGRTPVVATWMLMRFGCSPNNDSIIGDLNERYCQGRSRTWYWRQALSAIFSSLITQVRTNKFLAVRALLTGWSLMLISLPLAGPLLQLLRGQPRGTGILPETWTTVRWLYVRGWIVPSADMFVFALISCVFAFGIGWLTGRLHRPYHAKLVLLFVGSWFLVFLSTVFIVFAQTLQDWPASNWRSNNPYFLVFGVAANILAMLSALAGGVLSGPGPDGPDRMKRSSG